MSGSRSPPGRTSWSGVAPPFRDCGPTGATMGCYSNSEWEAGRNIRFATNDSSDDGLLSECASGGNSQEFAPEEEFIDDVRNGLLATTPLPKEEVIPILRSFITGMARGEVHYVPGIEVHYNVVCMIRYDIINLIKYIILRYNNLMEHITSRAQRVSHPARFASGRSTRS